MNPEGPPVDQQPQGETGSPSDSVPPILDGDGQPDHTDALPEPALLP